MAVSLTPNLTTYFFVNYPYKNLSGLQDDFSKKPHFFYMYISLMYILFHAIMWMHNHKNKCKGHKQCWEDA